MKYSPGEPSLSCGPGNLSKLPWLKITKFLASQNKQVKTETKMKLGDEFPNFEADTTIGRIKFYDWLGDS